MELDLAIEFGGEHRVGAIIREADSSPLIQQERSRGRTRATGADHQRFRSCEREFRHLSFSVARERSAQTIAMIQKRTMISGSGQPLSSK